jgi:hypothetical protein
MITVEDLKVYAELNNSEDLLASIEYCSKLLNNKDSSMVQMYWTQRVFASNSNLDSTKLLYNYS